MNPFATLKKHGFSATVNLYKRESAYRWASFRTRNVAQYKNPDKPELEGIEADLSSKGYDVTPLFLEQSDFEAFFKIFAFPDDYHGGQNSGYWYEKIFEHYLSYKLLGMETFQESHLYLDVAAGSSPWAKLVREQLGLNAFALDLAIRPPLNELEYYVEADATQTPFSPGSVHGISLHCAYEMFAGDSDIRAITEFSRILAPGGAVVVAPLYMHTHYCCYSSPEFWRRGHADKGAYEYVRHGMKNIPTSRKYDVGQLQERVLNTAQRAGLTPQLLSMRNQSELSSEIYCHFVLVLRKQ